MMRFFRGIKKKSNDNYFLALDIGTDVVKALVCEACGSKARVLGVGRKQQKLGDMQSGVVTDIASVIANCHAAIREAENMAGATTNRVIIGISGELVKGATNTTTYIRRDANSKIDLSELKNIVHKIQWRAFDVVRSQLSEETGYSEIDVKLVNAAIVDVRIDGYRVTNPIGFQGKEVTLSIFNAFAPLVHYGALQTIAAEIDKELISIAAEPYALTRCLGYEESGQFSAIFLDIGGGTTDVAVVRNGALEGTKMFTLGGRTFTKRLTQSLNISFKEAEEIKLAYSSDNLERQSNKIVREAMKIDSEVWLSGVVLTLEDFDNIDSFPSKILLSGGGAHLPEIKEALESREWFKSMRFSRKPQVSFASPKMVTNLMDETRLLKDHQDIVPMALANLAIEFINEEQVLSKLLKKVVRLMQI
ncbi:ethanolamine ammonia-lyase reactivating factor EutA [Candidatus Peregrinibacteria bacterium]|nr:ethanolamine ammonia-lyase reactivating factor EutA [Candidatus Peregrinibacteria bacterium]